MKKAEGEQSTNSQKFSKDMAVVEW